MTYKKTTKVEYTVIVVFFGSTETRKRERLTVRKHFRVDLPINPDAPNFVNIGGASETVWKLIKEWMEENHSNEPSHLLAIERVVENSQRYDRVWTYQSGKTRENCEPTPFPSFMPSNIQKWRS